MSTAQLTQTEYIVRLRDSVDMDHHIQRLQDIYNRHDNTAHKVTHKWTPDFVNAYLGEFNSEVLDALITHPDVEYVSENSKIKSDGKITKQTDACWGLARINQKDKLTGKPQDLKYQYQYDASMETGHNVDVYVVDSGIYIGHEDFGKRARWGISVQKNTKENPVTDDDVYGHGTHVAGIVGGNRYGVAKGVSLIAVKIENDKGKAHVNNSVEGLQWILKEVKRTKKPSVVNISGGVTPCNRFYNEIATMLVDAGIHVVVSAGNESKNAKDGSPASAPRVNTVGASNINDKQCSFSNWGQCVDFFAPGEYITSCWIVDKAGKKDPKVCGF
ncbi:peptidase S8/S53 domain-containing protein [Crassisporium funariophilum]|nr:peptidase S8/S53 domain-containing protein [Crassisporium funariophilum]